MKKKIDFYFDFLSPYSYVAWTWVRSKKEDYDWSYCPVSVPSVVAHYKTLGPAQIKPKRNLPFNSLYALRLSLKSVAGVHQYEIIDALFNAGWGKGLDIGNDDVIKEILATQQLPVEDLFLKMEDRASRLELKKGIEDGLQRELFGVPTFFVDEEMFWGNDSIKYLEMYLAGLDPLDHEKYQLFLSKHQF